MKSQYKEIVIYLALTYNLHENLESIFELFDTLDLKDTVTERDTDFTDLPNDPNKYLNDEDNMKRLVNAAFKGSVKLKFSKVIDIILKKDSKRLKILKEDLKVIYKMNQNLCLSALVNKIKIERQKYSRLKIIRTYFDDVSNQEKLFYDESPYVNFLDILDVMIDLNQNSQSIEEFLDTIEMEEDTEFVIAMLIMDNRFNLTKRYIKHYNPVFTKIAIESDNFDIAIMLKTLFPIQYTVNEKLYLDSVIISIQKTNCLWLAKIYMLKSLMQYSTYLKAESV